MNTANMNKDLNHLWQLLPGMQVNTQGTLFSSVQDGTYVLRKAHLSAVSPTLPLKQFQCSSD